MPFDIGFWELTIIAVVALVIVGPERLPKLARTTGLWVSKARRMVSDVKRDIDRELKASELSEIKEGLETVHKEVTHAGETIKQASDAEELKSSVKDAVQEVVPVTEDLKSDLDEIDEIAKQMDEEVNGTPAGTADRDVASADSDLSDSSTETSAAKVSTADNQQQVESTSR